MLQSGKRRFLITVLLAVLAALLFVAAFLFVRARLREQRYERFYEQAVQAFSEGDYAEAEYRVRQALAIRTTEAGSLLLADICLEWDDDLDGALESLYLGYSMTGSEELSSRIEELKSRKRLDFGDEGTVLLAGQEIALNVKAVSLRGLGLKTEDIEPLAELTALEGLDLADNRIRQLDALSGLTQLGSLDLSRNPIYDLTPLSSLTGLTTLYLDGNVIPDITPLYSLTRLRMLSLTDAQLTQGQRTALMQALPLCEIHFSEEEQEPEGDSDEND